MIEAAFTRGVTTRPLVECQNGRGGEGMYHLAQYAQSKGGTVVIESIRDGDQTGRQIEMCSDQPLSITEIAKVPDDMSTRIKMYIPTGVSQEEILPPHQG